jgi:hypothetical protein
VLAHNEIIYSLEAAIEATELCLENASIYLTPVEKTFSIIPLKGRV